MAKTYTCPRHHIEVTGPCEDCIAEWPDLPHPDDMTGDERAAEMEIMGILTTEWGQHLDRICALVGRDIMTHEMAGGNWKNLIEEARNRDHPHPHEVVKLLTDYAEAHGQKVLIIPVEDEK